MPNDNPSAETAPTKAEERKISKAAKEAAPAAPSSSATAKAEPEKRTPAEWAAKRKLTRPRDPRLPQSTDWADPSYVVADKLYGWSEQAYHFQDEADRFLITESDFVMAVRLAPQHPTVEPHAPAIGPIAAPRFKDFKPARNLKRERAEAEAKAKQETV